MRHGRKENGRLAGTVQSMTNIPAPVLHALTTLGKSRRSTWRLWVLARMYVSHDTEGLNAIHRIREGETTRNWIK